MSTDTFAAGVASGMCGLNTPTSLVPAWRDRHNSIITATAKGNASAKAALYGAAKQAAPPRGVPR